MSIDKFDHLWTLLRNQAVVRASDREKVRLCVMEVYGNLVPPSDEIVPRENYFSSHNWTTFANKINDQIGFTPNPAPGIFVKCDTVVLKSVDGTSYYDDDVTNRKRVTYTGYGQVGDQQLTGVNQKLLEATHIWLYRVIPRGKTKRYIWYGKYEIIGDPYVRTHPDITGVDRQIYLVDMEQVSD